MSDYLFYNGTIYTLDQEQPQVRALAVRDGRILAIGSEGKVQAAIGSKAEAINLEGRAMIPGLTDAHVHIIWHGLARRDVRLTDVTSLDRALSMIQERAAQLPADAWLRGGGWNHADWGDQWPSRNDLDRVCPDRPAMLMRKDGHSVWVNSLALQVAGVDRNTPDPSGGQIQRDQAGEPTGILLENAIALVRNVVTPPTQEERLAALQEAFQESLSYGMTSLHVPPGTSPGDGRQTLNDLQLLRERGRLTVRNLAHLAAEDLDAALKLALRSGLGDPWLRVGNLKIFADGSLGSETAEMLAAYEGRDHQGLMVVGLEEMHDLVLRANRSGIAVIVHAIGDGANRRVLDAIARARQLHPEISLALPNRIEHAQVLHPLDISRFAELDVVASVQPIHCTSDITVAEKLWGARCRYAYAWRSLLDAGAVLAFGSDAPVESLNPWYSVHAAVTRRRRDGSPEQGWYSEQCLNLDETFQAFCVGPAICSGEAAFKGKLVPGHLADLAVLSRDPYQIDPQDLHTITADLTMVDGRVAYERPT
jgi:hypothetical protein